jgi:ornithine carbamoyltransferase
MDFRLASPPGFVPDAGVMDKARASARRTGGKIMVTPDPVRAALGAGVLYTDVWVSMGQDAEREKRLKLFRGYQINSHLLRQAAPGAKVMHCLPAHRGEEITDSVMDGDQSIVFDQAENRLYNAMAALLWCCRGGKS